MSSRDRQDWAVVRDAAFVSYWDGLPHADDEPAPTPERPVSEFVDAVRPAHGENRYWQLPLFRRLQRRY